MAIQLLKVAQTAAQAARRANIARLKKNMTRRAKTLSEAGIETKAMATLQELKAIKPENAAQRRSLEKRLMTLDKAKGLRAETAPGVAKREAAARDRERLVEASKSPYEVKSLTLQERRKAARLVTSRLKAKVKKVDEDLGGSIGAERAKQIMDEAPDLKTANHNQLAKYLNKAGRALDFKTLTKQGIEAQKTNFGRVFGRSADDFTRDEESAMWDALKREQEKYGGRYSSWAVAEAVMETIDPNQPINFMHQFRDGRKIGTMAFFSNADQIRTEQDLEARGIRLAKRGTIPVPRKPEPEKDPVEKRIESLEAKRFLQMSRRDTPKPF